MKTINEIADAVHENAFQKGFHPEGQDLYSYISQQMCNIHCEVSELWEAYRKGEQHKPCDKSGGMVKMGLRPLSSQEEELADLIIRCLDVSRRLGIDIQSAIEVKHLYNTTRPFKHGKLC